MSTKYKYENLLKKKKEIFVAEYEVKLPSEEEIKRRIEGLEE